MSSREENIFAALPTHSNGNNVEMEITAVMLEEDNELLQLELESIIEALRNPLNIPCKLLLEKLAHYIRVATVTMTSVPKPLKYLAPHYGTLKSVFELVIDQEKRELFAEILSMLSITSKCEQDCLLYRLKCNANSKISDWGHEYVRHLSIQIAVNYFKIPIGKRLQVIELVKQIVAHNMEHNAETETCDLLMEIDHLHILYDYVDQSSFPRVALYLQSCHSYVTEPEKMMVLNTLYKLIRKFKNGSHAMFCAFLLNDKEKIKEVFYETENFAERKQLALMLARQQILLELDCRKSDNEALVEIMSNGNYSKYFLNFAREVDIMEPKTPDDIFKTNLGNIRSLLQARKIDSAKQNLAASFVNGFVNTGFCVDKLLSEDGNKWIYRNRDHAMLSATASYGLVHLWNIEGGLTILDKYMYCEQVHIKAGALLGCGIVNCGINSEVDAAHALLSEHVDSKDQPIQVGAILGLGIAYAGSNRSLAIDTLKSVFENKKEISMEVLSITALSLGLIGVGSCNAELSEILIYIINKFSAKEAENCYSHYLWLALGLIYLGKQKAADNIIQKLEKLRQPYKSLTKTTVEVCAYAGTGNLLKIQKMLHICLEHYPPRHKASKNATDNKNENIAKKSTANKDKPSEHPSGNDTEDQNSNTEKKDKVKKDKIKHKCSHHDKEKKYKKKNEVYIDISKSVLKNKKDDGSNMDNENQNNDNKIVHFISEAEDNNKNDKETLQSSKKKDIKKTEVSTQTNVVAIGKGDKNIQLSLAEKSIKKFEVSTQTEIVKKVNNSTEKKYDEKLLVSSDSDIAEVKMKAKEKIPDNSEKTDVLTSLEVEVEVEKNDKEKFQVQVSQKKDVHNIQAAVVREDENKKQRQKEMKTAYEKKKTEMEDKMNNIIEEGKKACKKEQVKADFSSTQSIAVIGIAIISMAEDIGIEMSTRMFGILLRYCEPCVRRVVPLAIGLLYASNPKMLVLEMLSKYSHDSDIEVAQNAIFAMGLICAGTNNARNAAMLRQLAQYYAKIPNTLFMVRIAQGLNYLGKGTLTLSPYHSDGQIMNPMAIAGLLTTLFSVLDTKNLIMGHSHYLLYALVPAIQSRMLMTFDEDMNQLQVPVRIGIAVDTVGQAGNPKTITAFQTQTTPVLLSMGERAELATEEYIPLSAFLEGLVILRKNPNYMD